MAVTKIMALGDSVTIGDDGTATYRYWLQQHFDSLSFNYDFVGSLTGTRNNGTPYLQGTWDHDHEGVSGETLLDINARAATAVSTYLPEIILLQGGINDLSAGRTGTQIVNDLETLIATIRGAKSDAIIYFANIPAQRDVTQTQLDAINADIGTKIAAITTVTSPVYYVDWALGYSAAVHNYDDHHPNPTGEQRQAMRFADALFEYGGIANYWTKPETPLLSNTANVLGWSGDDSELTDTYDIEGGGVLVASGIVSRSFDTEGQSGPWRVRGRRAV